MALQVPGLFTRSMAATVSPRNTSSDSSRSRGAAGTVSGVEGWVIAAGRSATSESVMGWMREEVGAERCSSRLPTAIVFTPTEQSTNQLVEFLYRAWASIGLAFVRPTLHLWV